MDMFGASTGDSIEANMIGTTATANFTNFDSMRTAAVTNMIHSSYGTRNSTPTESHDFRGYPRPAVTLTYRIRTQGSSPQAINERLTFEATIASKVGFNLVIDLDVTEWDYNSGSRGASTQHDETYTINAGGTTMSSSTMTAWSGNERIVDEYYQTVDRDMRVVYTANHPTYDASPTVKDQLLDYTAALPPITWAGNATYTSQVDCNGTLGAFNITYYSPTTPFQNGMILYTTSAMTTNIGALTRARDNAGRGVFKRYYTNSAGVVAGLTQC
jgi:hypothetical protein